MNELTDDYPCNGDQSTDTLLIEAMREYQAAIDAGRAPDRAAFLAKHPAVTNELADCLDGFRYLHNLLPIAEPAVATGVPLGDFQIVRELGRGGMGVVYEAEQLSLRRRVALKVLPFASTLDARQLQRFRTEATAAAHLHHPNVVQVYGVGCERGVHYYAMQYIEGRTLADVIRGLILQSQASEPAMSNGAAMNAATVRFAPHDRSTRGKASLREFFRTAARWGVQAADALEHAHQLGVIHRDIKPANLLIDSHGELHVTDFGLAHVGGSDQLTCTGDVVGTLRYMSPEQARGDRVADPRSDVYSLGITLYQLLTISTPFASSDRHTVLRQVLEDDPPPIRRLQPSVPAELAVIVHKAMAKTPSERYSSAQAMADDLRAWLEDRPIRGRPPTLGQRASKWARRHRAAVTSASVAAILISAALAISSIAIAAKHGEVVGALKLSDESLRAESQARADLAQTLDRELQTAYGYRMPLAQSAWRDGNPRRAHELLVDCPAELRGWEWHYLNRRLDEAATTLRSPDSGKGALTVEFDGDHRLIRSYSSGSSEAPSTVEVWSADTFQLVHRFQAPAGAGDRLELSRDGCRCAIFHSALDPSPKPATAVSVFDVQTQDKLLTIEVPGGTTVVHFNPDSASIAVADHNGSVTVFDAVSGNPIRATPVHQHPIVDLVWSPDGRSIASLGFEQRATNDRAGRISGVGHLHVWRAADGEMQWRKQLVLSPPLNLSGRWLRFSPLGRMLIANAGATVEPQVFNAGSGAAVSLPVGAALRAVSDDDRLGLLILADRAAQIFDFENAKPLTRWRLHEPDRLKAGSFELNRARMAAAFSAESGRAAIGHDDGRISIWDTATGQEVLTLPGAAKALRLAFDADGGRLAATTTDRSVAVWNVATAGESRTIVRAAPGTKFSALAVSPDGRTLAGLCGPNRGFQAGGMQLIVWDLPSGGERLRIPAPELGGGWITPGGGNLRFSRDGERIAFAGLVADGGPQGGFRRVVVEWDASTGRSTVVRDEPVAASRHYVMHESEPLVPPMSLDDLRVEFGADNRAVLQMTHGDAIDTPGAREITVTEPGRPAPRWSLPQGDLSACGILSPDGRLCAVVPRILPEKGPFPALEVWDTIAGRRLWELTSDTGPLLAATFSADGRRVVTQPATDKGVGTEPWRHRAVIWNAETGQPICDFSPPAINGPFGEKSRPQFTFSADNSRLASFAAADGVTIWDANAGRELLTLGEFGGVIAEAHFTRDGLLVTRSHDGAIAVWDGREMR